MNTNPYLDPAKTLRAMVLAGSELIYARDPALGAVLDVAPPAVEAGESPSYVYAAAGASSQRGMAYRAARKVYRELKSAKVLQPLLERVRHEILIRS